MASEFLLLLYQLLPQLLQLGLRQLELLFKRQWIVNLQLLAGLLYLIQRHSELVVLRDKYLLLGDLSIDVFLALLHYLVQVKQTLLQLGHPQLHLLFSLLQVVSFAFNPVDIALQLLYDLVFVAHYLGLVQSVLVPLLHLLLQLLDPGLQHFLFLLAKFQLFVQTGDFCARGCFSLVHR